MTTPLVSDMGGILLCGHILSFWIQRRKHGLYKSQQFLLLYNAYTKSHSLQLCGWYNWDRINDKATQAYKYLVHILQELGFPLSKLKLISSTTDCNCLGVMVNTIKCTLTVPDVVNVLSAEKT